MLALWAIDGWRNVAFWGRATAFLLPSALTLVPTAWTWPAKVRGDPPFHGAWRRLSRLSPYAKATLLGIVAASAFRAFPVSYARNSTFADGPRLPSQVDDGATFPAELLTMRAFEFCNHVLRRCCGPSSALDAIRFADSVAGGLFVGSLFLFARASVRDGAGQSMLLFGATLAGPALMFFGYVETTPLALSFMAVYFAASAIAVTAARARSEGPRALFAITVALSAMTFAMLSHAGSVLLIPSGGALLATTAREGGSRWRQLVSWRNVGLTTVLVIAPCMAVLVIPHYMRGDLGNLNGGGDGIAWVPLAVDEAHRPSPWVYYGMFSAWHFLDVLSAVVFAAPLAAPLLIAAFFLRNQAEPVGDTDTGVRVRFVVALATASCLIIPLGWNHDFGMWGDWNIAACYLFPLQVLGWLAFALAVEPFERRGGFYLGVFLPLVLVQVEAALGLALQLTS